MYLDGSLNRCMQGSNLHRVHRFFHTSPEDCTVLHAGSTEHGVAFERLNWQNTGRTSFKTSGLLLGLISSSMV